MLGQRCKERGQSEVTAQGGGGGQKGGGGVGRVRHKIDECAIWHVVVPAVSIGCFTRRKIALEGS